MEFFRYIDCPRAEVTALQQQLTIANLPVFCASIDKVLADNGDTGVIYCLWGQFDVHRLTLRNGVRFSLLDCPHALCWSLTLDSDTQRLIVHCTIDKQQQDQEFTESIETFVDDWRDGIQRMLCAS